MSDDTLTWLMQWYVDQCDDDWEHSFGIKIDTLDNPGWTLKVDLRGTRLETLPFPRTERGEVASSLGEWKRSGSWLVARVEDATFQGACGPTDLPQLIGVFRDWAKLP